MQPHDIPLVDLSLDFGSTEAAPGYTLADLLRWVDAVRHEFLKDPLIARLPYDRHFIAGMAQGLPELSWFMASADLVRIPLRSGLHGPGEPALDCVTPVPDTHRELGLVAFLGHLLCPRGQPDTMVERLLQQMMATTVSAMDGRWDSDRYRLAQIEITPVDRNAPFDRSFGPSGLLSPATHVARMFQEYRARHLEAVSLEHATPLVGRLGPHLVGRPRL